MAAKSCCGLVIAIKLNFSCKIPSTVGVMKAGRVGPMRMFLMPK